MKKKLFIFMLLPLFWVTSPLWATETMTVHFANATTHTITLICNHQYGCDGLPSTISNNKFQNWSYTCAPRSGDPCPTASNPENFSAQVKKIKFNNNFSMYRIPPKQKNMRPFWVISASPPAHVYKTNLQSSAQSYAITVYFYTGQTGAIQVAMCNGQQNSCSTK